MAVIRINHRETMSDSDVEDVLIKAISAMQEKRETRKFKDKDVQRIKDDADRMFKRVYESLIEEIAKGDTGQ